MARKDFWKSDWFLGLVVAIAVFLLSATDLVGSLEGKACDLSVRASAHAAGGDIALVTGDPSIAYIRRWPWSGEVPARLIESPLAAHAKVIKSGEEMTRATRECAGDYGAAGVSL